MPQHQRNPRHGDGATIIQLSAAEAERLAHCGQRAAESVLERFFAIDGPLCLEHCEQMVAALAAAMQIMRGADERRLDRALSDDERVMDVLWDSLGQTAHMAMTAVDDGWEPESQTKWRRAWKLEADVMHRLTD